MACERMGNKPIKGNLWDKGQQRFQCNLGLIKVIFWERSGYLLCDLQLIKDCRSMKLIWIIINTTTNVYSWHICLKIMHWMIIHRKMNKQRLIITLKKIIKYAFGLSELTKKPFDTNYNNNVLALSNTEARYWTSYTARKTTTGASGP